MCGAPERLAVFDARPLPLITTIWISNLNALNTGMLNKRELITPRSSTQGDYYL
jgi:hypothetical protein